MRALIRRALPSHPDHAGLLYYAAWLDYREERLDDAELACKRLLEQDPRSEDARALLKLLIRR